MSRHWTRYMNAEGKSARRKARFFSEHWDFKRRKGSYLPNGTSRHQTNRKRLNRRDRHETKRSLRP